jgi:hypothetical protein
MNKTQREELIEVGFRAIELPNGRAAARNLATSVIDAVLPLVEPLILAGLRTQVNELPHASFCSSHTRVVDSRRAQSFSYPCTCRILDVLQLLEPS